MKPSIASPSRPALAITLGDPAGIGPEVILKALAQEAWFDRCHLTLIGSRRVLTDTYTHLLQQQKASNCPTVPLMDPEQLTILEVQPDQIASPIPFSVGDATTGAASFAYLEAAIDKTMAGQFQGIVTGPIAKSNWQAGGHNYPGQTELLAEKAGVDRFGMLFVAQSPQTGWHLRTLLATTHIPLHRVPEVLTPALMTTKLSLLTHSLRQDFGLQEARIAIAGLNPHSGEQGHLGHEEQDWLIPWLQQAQTENPHLRLEGPVPPDTLWLKPARAWADPSSQTIAHDAYLALYHDQGLIPVKMLAFDRAVNTTIGLPFVRTSPDHGTAFDIAGRGIAKADSMRHALQWAIEMANHRSAQRDDDFPHQ
ncbi:MAG: 4-hydroxythreonine-4-phosphate dehydrogenase PdxA [Leptolyngbyaceae cyanobacterium bins.59]|nr:4-hydroxythreonine-4-phosphate dehydrogenase PdxA [Leptolyngbyaceae cyanobacterium bins.59]